MNGSSSSESSAFVGLRLSHIAVMLDLLHSMELTTVEQVERRYGERAILFTDTLRFLTTIGVVARTDAGLKVVRGLVGPDEMDPRHLASVLIGMMFGSQSPYRSEVSDYISRFEVKNGAVEYRPDSEQRSAESPVRNFLMDIGLVRYDITQDVYRLSDDGLGVYALAAHESMVVSPSEFAALRQRREEIGLLTETAVMEYEIQRVGVRLAGEVRHVAIQNVAAGYDIRSVTQVSDGLTQPRYIEVKAVPNDTYRFYWSSNERNVAEILGSCYYLYLVPIHSGTPDVQKGFALSAIRALEFLKGLRNGSWKMEY